MKTIGVVPVKGLTEAHGRLADVLSESERAQLADALFDDLLAKLSRSRCLDDVLIVTSDPTLARQARWRDYGVLWQDEDAGHSHAAAAGARNAMEDGAERVAMLPVDCPELDIAELDAHIGRSPRTLIVPDHHGTGTNALILNPPDVFSPDFGPDSCSRHVGKARAAGISFGLERIPSLAHDLDGPEDMVVLRDRLLLHPDPAPRTAKVLWELGDRSEQVAVA